ncbi:unnamed protein product, partial [Closterium sp. NIES-54]
MFYRTRNCCPGGSGKFDLSSGIPRSMWLIWLPHIHPPQQQLQQWETEEEEEQGTPLTRHPPTRHPQTLKE